MKKLVILITGCIILSGCLVNKPIDTPISNNTVQPALPASSPTTEYVDTFGITVVNPTEESTHNPYLDTTPMGHIPETESPPSFSGLWGSNIYYTPIYTATPTVIYIWKGTATIIKQ
jgi:hypothetical protein